MVSELKGVTWEELMEASAIVTKRETGKRVTAKEYEQRIKNSTFGEAIWATGGLEKFFVGFIAIGELVIARKVAKAGNNNIYFYLILFFYYSNFKMVKTV